MAVRLDEAEKQILARLMADFSERALSSNQLSSGYVGSLIFDLATAVCVGGEKLHVSNSILPFRILKTRSLLAPGSMRWLRMTQAAA